MDAAVFRTKGNWLVFLLLLALNPIGGSDPCAHFSSLPDDSTDEDFDDAYQHNLGDCAFETNQCRYVQPYVEGLCGYGWTWDEDRVDHTINDTAGAFLSITPPHPSNYLSACAASPHLPATDGKARCLTFWYQFTGNVVQALQVVASRDRGLIDGMQVFWKQSNDQGKGWKFGRTSIEYDEDHYVVFEAVTSNRSDSQTSSGIVALDDIIFTEGPCSVIPENAVVPINVPTTTTTTANPNTTSTIAPDIDDKFTCSFEKKGFCSWKNSADATMEWNIKDDMEMPSDLFYGLPNFDHTGTSRSNYIYVQARNIKGASAIARLESPILVTKGDHCLTFWYHMYGSDVDTLDVYAKKDDLLGAPIWARQRNQGVGWKKGMINIEESKEKIMIVFEAHVPKNGDAMIALDDFSLLRQACPQNWMSCDFEQPNLCNYKSNNKISGWQRQSGSHISSDSVPSTDHTFNSEFGHYVVLNGSLISGQTPYTLTSPEFASAGFMCLRFWYYMRTDDSAYLSVTEASEKTGYLVQLSGGLECEPRWRLVQKTFVNTSSSTQLIFIGSMQPSNIIAIDDIQIISGFCSDEGDCNMENGDLCTWTNSPDDHFDWLIGQGRGENMEDAGPVLDHTFRTNEGHYIYFDAGQHNAQDFARIYSTNFERTGEETPHCMHFWYNIQGNSAGSLSIKQNFSMGTVTIWQAEHNQGLEWNYAKVPFDSNDKDTGENRGSFQLVIEGSVGDARKGTIAMDDIVFSDSECSVEPIQTDLGAEVTTPPTPTTPKGWLTLEALLSCPFQLWSNYCHWQQSQSDDMDWSIGNLKSSGSPYVPPLPNPGTGKRNEYTYVVSNFHQTSGSKASLDSAADRFDGRLEYCLTFEYYMFGSDVGNLTLFVESSKALDFEGHFVPYWKRVGTQEDRWLQATTTLKLLSEAFMRLHLEAELGFDGVIAVRELQVTQGACNIYSTCSFETGLKCQWEEEGSQAFPLVWQYGSGINTNFTGPPIDHTTMSEKGLYQFVKNSKGSSGVGQFVSPKLDQLRGTHCFSFWYYMGLAGSGSLEVFIESDSLQAHSQSLWTTGGDKSPRWHLAQVPIVMYKAFQIVLEAIFDGKNEIDLIAIDDLTISREACGKPASCSFDDGPCGYMNDINDDDFDWLLGFGRTRDPKAILGPTVDALGNGNGLYMYADMTRTINTFGKSRAYLRSEVVFSSSFDAQFCLEFSYIRLGIDESELNVFTNKLDEPHDSFNPIWVSANEPVQKWTPVKVPFKCTKDFEIVFQTTQRQYSKYAFIGFDEVHLSRNPDCKEIPQNHTHPEASQYFVDFEDAKKPTGNWEITSSSYMWHVANGGGFGYTEKPMFDHTKQTFKGHYLYSGPDFGVSDPYSQFTSSDITHTGQVCIKFWYQMYGRNIERLQVVLIPFGQKSEIIWSRSGTQGEMWRYEQIPFTNIHSSKVEFRGYAFYDRSGYMAIDDVEILLESCPPRKLCSFDDNDFCDFDQGYNDNFEWNLTASPIPENGEFPVDHTTQTKESGGYAYLNTIRHNNDQFANLISPMYPPMDNACVKFWFYTSIQFSEFWVHLSDNDNTISPGEYFDGTVSNIWNSAAVPFHPKTAWQVTFQGIVSGYAEVAVAIDDITISFNDSCSVAEYCDFEEDDCLWHNAAREEGINDVADWRRKSSASKTDMEGSPSIDHTTRMPTGHYLIAVPSYETEEGHRIILISNVLTMDYKCFSFWYHTNDKNGVLQIWYQSSGNYQDGELLETIKMNLTSSWLPKAVDLPTKQTAFGFTYFLVKVVAVLGEGNNAIAIDDLMFEKTSCQDSLHDKFQCQNNEQVIAQLQVCDFIPDCKDKSDERNCGSCDFESGDCGYRDITPMSDVEWVVVGAGNASEKNPSAPLDRLHGITGHYVWTEIISGQSEAGVATMQSAVIQYASSSCHVTFWMYSSMSSTDWQKPNMHVDVVTSHGHTQFTIYDLMEIPKGVWTKALVYIGHIPQPFSLKFTLQMYYEESYLAIDDINFQQCNTQMTNCSSKDMFRCASRNGCIDKHRVCDFTADCDDSSDELNCEKYLGCDFEQGFCFWEAAGNDEWIRENAAGYYKPHRDHTLGTPEGHFLKADWDFSKYNTVVKLGGLVFLPTTNCTMRFYYYLKSTFAYKTTELKVSTRHYTNGDEKVYITRDRSNGEYFFREEVTFNEPKRFEVIIEAHLYTYNDIVALDDISFDLNCQLDNTSLSVGSTREPDYCAEDQFECKSRSLCIKLIKVCDFIPDCPDGSDELDCGDCTFENSRCGWKDTSSGMFRWERRQGLEFTSGIDNIPNADHTTDKTNGWFLLLTKNAAGDSFAESSVLESPVFGSTGPLCRLSFWYHASGTAGVLKLSVQSRDRNTVRSIATLPDNEHQPWKEFSVPLGEMGLDYQLVFEASINEQEEGAEVVGIAIDDVKLSNCSLKETLNHVTFHNLSCDFESGLCDWHQGILNDVMDWKVGSGSTPTEGTGPREDHTTGTGHYLYLEYDNMYAYDGLALLVSEIMPPTDGLCIRFWYHMFGEWLGSLQVSVVSVTGKNSTLIWTESGSKGNLWRGGMATIISRDLYQVVITGISGISRRSDIGLDDITLIKGPCRQRNDAECTFELGTCGWKTKMSPDSGEWKWSRADSVPMYGYKDHTTDSTAGNVVYADLSAASNSSRTVLQSEIFLSGREGGCFNYWSIMERFKEDDFRVEVFVNNPTNGEHMASSQIDSAGYLEWHYGHISIKEPNIKFQITIEATYLHEHNPVIVLDDLIVTNSSCLEYGSCDFEYDWCGWSQDESVFNYFKWLRNSGRTKSDYTGPDVDHTRGSVGLDNGFYVFVDASSGKPGQQAVMNSPVLRVGHVACFSFYYHMLGEETGKLTISVATVDETVEVFSVEGEKGGSWQPVFLEIHNLPTESWLVIKATLKGGTKGDIAIDDLLVEADECKSINVVVTTPFPSSTTPFPSSTTPFPSSTTPFPSSTTPFPSSTTPFPSSTTPFSSSTTPFPSSTTPFPSSTQVTPPPSSYLKSCNADGEVNVPVFAWCDGFKDCPNGEDESEECKTKKKCDDADKFPCGDNENTCISYNKICDGVQDCAGDALDESFCDIGCIEKFCANDVTCDNQTVNVTMQRPTCSCGSKYGGYRCQVSIPEPRIETASKGWIAGVVILVLMILFGIGFLVYKKCINPRRQNDDRPITIENPTYDFPTNQNIQLSNMTPNPDEHSITQLGTPPIDDQADEGVVNPLYE